MNDDQIDDPCKPPDPPQAGSPAAPSGLLCWLPWLAAAGFALLAGFALAAYFALQAQVAILRDEALLAEIQGKTLRQQIEADQIIAAQRLADLRNALAGPRDLDRLLVIPFASAGGAASPSVAVAVLDPDRREGELIVSALPALASDKSYQLWFFDAMHPAGTSLAVFAIDSTTTAVRIPFKLSRSNADGARFKISLERKGGASTPEGLVVLAGP
jgi:hypothetical protein